MDFKEQLKNELITAARGAFQSLFANGERFYYVTLATDGLANTPYISAMSQEEFERRLAEDDDAEKWDDSESAFFAWEQERFARVKEMLAERAELRGTDEEYELRLSAMEEAMKQLDAEGLFAQNQPRSEIIALVEVIPPDYTNTERAYRLNDSSTEIFEEWLEEVAEELDDE